MVALKVRKVGNSLGLALPKDVLSHLQAVEGDLLYLVEGPDGGYHLTPYDPGFERKMARADDIISRYRNTLNVLSK